MVKSRLYCSEQIEIPETFPNILKTYAKAAIRTQPYDLLRWSAAYFRCLANDVPPPVKQRLEKDCKHGSLTKGYLRVLLEQVGKGYFISRRLLQQRWASLCLPEEELLKYLSVCRMLNWPQVHWLKVFAVMVGSLNETPRATFTMICELLTDDLEGGLASIPTWMFRECYKFISELDCSEEQCFLNGRKKLPNGNLEKEIEMGRMPEVLSATSIREAIFDKCMQRYNVDCQCLPKRTEVDETTFRAESCPVHGDQETTVSSGFQFLGDISDPTDILQRYNDFDSLILLLREAQGAKLHEYEGPSTVTQNNIDHALRREEEVMFEKELQSGLYEEASKKCMLQEKINMLSELGAPWTWIQQFAADSCMEKSFNFIEIESIISDITPPLSSDESFDFCKGRPVINTDRVTISAISDSSSEHASELLQQSDRTDEEWKKNPTLFIVRSLLKIAEEQSVVNVEEVSSVTTFLSNPEDEVWKAAGQPALDKVDIQEIIETLKAADKSGVTFETVDHMMNFLKYWKNKAEPYAGSAIAPEEQAIKVEEEPVAVSSETVGESAEENYEASPKSELPQETESLKLRPDQVMEKKTTTDSPSPAAALGEVTSKKPDNQLKQVRSIKEDAIDEIREKKPMLEIFIDSGILPEETKLGGNEQCEILGTVPKPEIKQEEPVVEEEQSAITPSGTVSGLGDISDISSRGPNPLPPKDRKINYQCPHGESNDSLCKEREDISCIVPPYPGIGPAVSKQTIQDFLTYLKGRSRYQKGMIMPKNFLEIKCPAMVDIDK